MNISFLGSYGDWTSDDANAENFCPETPFMFAFVWLIITWTLPPLLCCCMVVGICGKRTNYISL